MPITVGAIAAGGQAVLGVAQSLRANKLRKKAMADFRNNPYTTPNAATQAVNLAAEQAQGTRLPGQDLMEENLKATMAQGLSQVRKAAQTPTQIIASTIQSYNAQQKAQQALDLQAAQNHMQRQEIYRNMVLALAPYETKKWELNTLAPIQAQLNESAMMGQTGMQNIGQGIQSGIGIMANQAYLNKLGNQ